MNVRTHKIDKPTKAVILAAGLGTRMRPLTLKIAKPLVRVNGTSLLELCLNRLKEFGIQQCIVNVHYLGQQIIDFVRAYPSQSMEIIISDERDLLLDSAGALIKCRDFLGNDPFFVLNADTFWCEDQDSNLAAMAQIFDPQKMDILLLTAKRSQMALPERGDFIYDDDGHLLRAVGAPSSVTYAGAALINPAIFKHAKLEPSSLNLYFDRAIADQRLYGYPLQGRWYTVGTVEALHRVERLLKEEQGEA